MPFPLSAPCIPPLLPVPLFLSGPHSFKASLFEEIPKLFSFLHFLIKKKHSSHHDSWVQVPHPTKRYWTNAAFPFPGWFVIVTKKTSIIKVKLLNLIRFENPHKYGFFPSQHFRTDIFCYSDLHPTSLTAQHSQLTLGYYLPSLSQFHPLPIILLSNPVKKKINLRLPLLLKRLIQQCFPFMEEKWGWKSVLCASFTQAGLDF